LIQSIISLNCAYCTPHPCVVWPMMGCCTCVAVCCAVCLQMCCSLCCILHPLHTAPAQYGLACGVYFQTGCIFIHTHTHIHTYTHIHTHTRTPRHISSYHGVAKGSRPLNYWVSFAKQPYKNGDFFQKKTSTVASLQIVATPYLTIGVALL